MTRTTTTMGKVTSPCGVCDPPLRVRPQVSVSLRERRRLTVSTAAVSASTAMAAKSAMGETAAHSSMTEAAAEVAKAMIKSAAEVAKATIKSAMTPSAPSASVAPTANYDRRPIIRAVIVRISGIIRVNDLAVIDRRRRSRRTDHRTSRA